MARFSETEVRNLAAALHPGEVDKAGRPYIEHLERVVRDLKDRWPVASADEIAAAWLHDAIEDIGATPGSLLAAGVSPQAVQIVQAATRPEGSDHLDLIAEMAAMRPAVRDPRQVGGQSGSVSV